MKKILSNYLFKLSLLFLENKKDIAIKYEIRLLSLLLKQNDRIFWSNKINSCNHKEYYDFMYDLTNKIFLLEDSGFKYRGDKE